MRASRLLPATVIALAGALLLAAPAAAPAEPTLLAPKIDTQITVGPPDGSTIEPEEATFVFRATRDTIEFPGAVFHCSVDGAPSFPCSSPTLLDSLGEGAHTFSVYAEDPGSQTADPEPATRSFTVVGGGLECDEFESEEEDDGEGFDEEGLECEGEAEDDGPAPPEECILRGARARVLINSAQDRVRLVIRYTAFAPADVNVEYRLSGGRGSLRLGSAHQRFSRHGVFRLTEHLGETAMDRVRAAHRFTVTTTIPDAPGYCRQYQSRHLTIRRVVHGQPVWFQAGSVFGTGYRGAR